LARKEARVNRPSLLPGLDESRGLTGKNCALQRRYSSGNLPGLMQQVHIGLIGAGTVGGGVCAAIQKNGALIGSRLGVTLRIARVAVRDPKKARAVCLPAELVTTSWKSIVSDPKIDIVVELIGGTTAAREVVLAALSQGKPVVTANKALLSKHGKELFAAAEENNTSLYYEASVAGGIPIIKVLREGLVGNRITRLYGIVNGTCNYILTRMKFEGAEFEDVLAEAQKLGFAEAEPSLDVDGHDAAHKIGILASLAHGFWVDPARIQVEGIRHISKLDIQFAEKLGYTIKLLGVVKIADQPGGRRKKGSGTAVEVSVGPALVPNAHVLASVNHVFNAVFARGDVAGDTLYYGRGAGQDATASAVLSDLADAALNLKCGSKTRLPAFAAHEKNGAVIDMASVVSRFYLRLSVIDKAGTLAQIAAILGQGKIGISSVIQPEGHEGESVPLILMIHDAPYAAMRKALGKIGKLGVVKGSPVLIRVETFE
jgi:homoserine dehydrogenase